MTHRLVRSNRNYRLLLSGCVVSNLGDGLAAVAIPWLASLLTRDPLMISTAAMAGTLPWLLFALPAGVWTDRANRRLLMIRADCVRLGLTLCIVAMTVSFPAAPIGAGEEMSSVAMLAAIALLLGTAEVVRDNASQTVLPSIVPSNDLERANGQIWSAEQVMGRFVGPPLAGTLIGAGIVAPFGFNAATLALSIGIVWLITLPVRTPTARKGLWPAMWERLEWMLRNPAILRLAVMLGVFNAVAVGGWTVLVLYAEEVLDLAAPGYGFLLACAAAGGVVGGLVAPEAAPEWLRGAAAPARRARRIAPCVAERLAVDGGEQRCALDRHLPSRACASHTVRESPTPAALNVTTPQPPSTRLLDSYLRTPHGGPHARTQIPSQS